MYLSGGVLALGLIPSTKKKIKNKKLCEGVLAF
jgi:hypothetical protein